MKFKLVETFEEDVLSYLEDFYGVAQEPYGPTYILPNGHILNISNCKHHAEVEKTLIDAGFSGNEYIPTGGSPSMRELGAVRCDTVKYYIELPPEQLTRKQYNTLLIWLDYLTKHCRIVEVIADMGRVITTYNLRETISDDIVDRIRRYYVSGRLYEDTDVKHLRQYDAKYQREALGEDLKELDAETIKEEFKRNPRFIEKY